MKLFLLIISLVFINLSLFSQQVVTMKVEKDCTCNDSIAGKNDIITSGLISGSIMGRAYVKNNEQQIPVSNCTITLKSSTCNCIQFFTDSAGMYIIRSIMPGRYTISAEKKDFGKVEFKNVQISDSTITFQDFVFESAKKEKKKLKIKRR